MYDILGKQIKLEQFVVYAEPSSNGFPMLNTYFIVGIEEPDILVGYRITGEENDYFYLSDPMHRVCSIGNIYYRAELSNGQLLT